jgi:hypothetical protein
MDQNLMSSSSSTSYDQALHRDDTEEVQRTQARSSWWIMAALFAIFLILCTTTGIRCANSIDCVIVDKVQPCGPNANCTVYQIPSLGTLLNNNETSALAISALDTLVVMHVLLTVNVSFMVKQYSILAVAFMLVAVVAMYVLFYVSLILGQWYISICPMIALAVWCASVVYGLRRYYHRQPSKPLFWTSAGSLVVFVLGVLLYIAFSPVPYPMLPSKDIAILSSQLAMAVSCVVFVVTVAFHTRCVSYEAVVERSFTTV